MERLGRRLTDWSYPDRFSQWHANCDAKLLNLAFTFALADGSTGRRSR